MGEILEMIEWCGPVGRMAGFLQLCSDDAVVFSIYLLNYGRTAF